MEVRSARTAHRTAALLLLLLASAITWAWRTEVDLVVRARGIVRPVNQTSKIVNSTDGQVLSGSTGSRVVEVRFEVGDRVSQGDLLIRLDTAVLDNTIARQKHLIETAREQAAQLEQLKQLAVDQYDANKARLEAELTQAKERLAVNVDKRTSGIRLAEATLKQQTINHDRAVELRAANAISLAAFEQTRLKLSEAREALKTAQLPVDDQPVLILQQSLALAEKKHSILSSELSLRLEVKQGAINSAELELASLEVQKLRSELRAPADGIVVSGDIKVGDTLEEGKTVIELADEDVLVFETWIPNQDMGHLQAGLPAKIKLDAYHYQTYGTAAGEVSFVAPDSQVRGPAEQQMAAYLVRVTVKDRELRRNIYHGEIKLGMAGSVEIVTEQRNVLTVLFRRLRRSISFS